MRMILAAAAMAAAVGAAGAAGATTFSGSYDVTGYWNSDNGGLNIDIDDLNGGHFNVTGLDFGESKTFNLFQISSDESINVPDPWYNPIDDDGTARPINVSFTFGAPVNLPGSPDAVITGTTVAMQGNWWEGGDYGQLTWSAPATVNFGNYGVLTITMQNTDFDQGNSTVKAKFSLAAPSVSGVGAVPEPATWGMMILGFGMAGATIRRRRTAVVAA